MQNVICIYSISPIDVGTIYQLSRELSKSQNWESYITIRFLTKDDLWITAKREHGFYPPLYVSIPK